MRFRIDPERSTLAIHATSSIHPINTSTAASGWIEVDPTVFDGSVTDGPVSGEIELALGEMRSGNPLIDREAERRLDIRHHPTVRGVLTELAAPDDEGRRAGTGELTFHGVTRTITGTLRLELANEGDGGETLHLTGTAELDVTDFGVQPPSLLVVKVHQQVRVELDAHARPQP